MRVVMDTMLSEIRFEESEGALRSYIHKAMHEKLGVKQDGYMFSPAYKAGYWDGIIDFYDKDTDTFPTGLIPQVETILNEIQSALGARGMLFQYEIIDDRPDSFLEVEDMDESIELNLGGEIHPLRDYQYDSVKSIIEKHTGIINVATNGGKCLYQFTRLLTKDGYKTIGSMFSDAGIDLYQSETTIENIFGIELINRYGQVEKPSHLTVNGVKHVNRITTEKGWNETITDNHPLLTVAEDGTFIWKEARSLQEGDWVVARKGDNVFGANDKLSAEKAQLVGMLVADGYIALDQRTEFTNDQEALLSFVENQFADYGRTYRRTRKGTKGVYVYLSDVKGTTKIHQELELEYVKSKDKKIPQCIMEAPREIQLAFLSGYLECEMSIEVPKCAIEVTSASRELLEQVQLMLLNMGYVANLSDKKVKGYEDNWYGRITLGAIDSTKLLEELSFITEQRQTQRKTFYEAFANRKRNPKGQTTPFGKEVVRTYKDTYPNPPKGMKKAFDFPKTISINRLRELIDMYPNGLPEYKAILDNLLDPSFVYSQVVSIEDAGYEPTYDLHMPETHSFIANGMVNHNTAIASGLIKTIKPYLEAGERIAFFTHSSSIFTQSADNIEQHLGIKVGRYGGGKKDIQQVTFVMIPTINTAISTDPEEKIKLSAKERLVKRIAKELAPKFTQGYNQRSLLHNFIQNFRVKTKVDVTFREMLIDIFDTCGTDNQVKMKFKNYEAQYQKIVEKKNGKVLKKYNDAMEFLESIAVMIVDEAHHTSSDTWYKTLTACKNAQYRMALTGSIDKTNHVLWQRMQGVFGDITTRVSNETLISLGHSAKPSITIFPILAPKGISEANYMDAYKDGIVENEYRNKLIAKLTKKCYDNGNGILVIINRIEHGELISDLLKAEGVPHDFIHGDIKDEAREDRIQSMRDGKLKVLISSTIIDEGVDIAGIDTLILGAGGKSLRQTLQRVGRGLRKKKEGENRVSVYDFYDLTNKHLKKHSEERRKIYVKEQFDITDIPIPS